MQEAIKDDTLASRHGWIITNGDFYVCKHGGHTDLARLVLQLCGELPPNPEYAAERLGWIKITTLTDSVEALIINYNRITQAQYPFQLVQ